MSIKVETRDSGERVYEKATGFTYGTDNELWITQGQDMIAVYAAGTWQSCSVEPS